jgi:putative hemolysin
MVRPGSRERPGEARILYELLVILLLVLLNGVFAAAEIAIVSVRSTRIEHLAETGGRRARALKQLRDNPERFLATVQIGITVVGAVAGTFGGAKFAADLRRVLAGVPALASHADAIALALVVVILSFLSLVLGELVPKSLALRSSEGYALFIGRPLLALSWIARPFVWVLTASSNLVLRIFGDHTTFTESRLSPDELQQLVDEAAKTGSVDPNAGEIASRAFDFAELTAAQVMVPRSRVVALSKGASIDEVRQVVLESGHTRMPVYEGQLDNVIGYVNVKDIIALSWERPLFVLADLVRPAYFVAGTMRATGLLNEMKRQRIQFAIVVDELGAMSGIVTLEDLVEEIVGEISSEHDRGGPAPIHRINEYSFLVQGDTPLRDVNRELALELPEGEGFTTVAGLCVELAGRIPHTGERLRAPDGTALEVTDATLRQVRAVRIVKRHPAMSLPGAESPLEPPA